MVVTIDSTDARPDVSGEGVDPRLELTEGNACTLFLCFVVRRLPFSFVFPLLLDLCFALTLR